MEENINMPVSSDECAKETVQPNQYEPKPLRLQEVLWHASRGLFYQTYRDVYPSETELLSLVSGSVIRMVAAVYEVTEDSIFGKSVRPIFLEARQVAIYLLDDMGFSSRDISQETGVSQSSVVKAINRIREIITVDRRLHGIVQQLKDRHL